MFCLKFRDFIEIRVDDSYPWLDTLQMNTNICLRSDRPFRDCHGVILIRRVKILKKDDVRSIGDGQYIGNGVYVDDQYGVRIEKKGENTVLLTVTQECNEWLCIAMELVLLSQDKTLIHAAGVEKDGNVLLMPSWGGVGKTATVCKYIRNYGWKLLGDDLVILDGEDGRVYPFLKPFVIYPYHRNLFPDQFRDGKHHIVKNNEVSNAMSKALPSIKRMVRPFPRLLAFMRKHNPQSMRVSPFEIFDASSFSLGGNIADILWLERCPSDGVTYGKCNAGEMASRICMVSSKEIFAEKLGDVFNLGGCGLFPYDETIGKMHEIIRKVIEERNCAVLEIPVGCAIDKIGEIIYRTLHEHL